MRYELVVCRRQVFMKKGQNKYEISETNGLEHKFQRICLNTPVRGLMVDY